MIGPERVFKRPPLVKMTVVFFLCLLPPLFTFGAEDEWVSLDAYVSASIGEPRVLIPFLADDASSSSICGLVYNGLTKVDKDLNIAGSLAERWDVSEDGLIITFHLHENVKWHDGEPFTSEDVVFTFKAIMDPKVGCPYISNFNDVQKIEALDDHTVRFTYSQPYAPALLKLGMGIIPKHLFKDLEDIRRSAYARSPVGTGPYVFSKWKSGQYIILEANEEYFEHAPGIKRYVFRIIPDQAVQFLELISGGIDSTDLNPYQYRIRSNTLEFRRQLEKYKYLAHAYTYVGFNLKDPLFQDKRVRQALNYAINRREIIDAVLLGLGEECTGPFLKGTVYYDETVAGYGYDPEKAARLLRQAGWRDTDGDGVLDKGKEKFSIKLVTNQGNQVREDVATIIQRQWAALGVKMDIQVIAWAAFLDQFINKKNFQAVILGWTLPIDPDSYSVWHSDSLIEGGLNFISYSNSEVDRLIEEGRREFDPGKRARIYRRMHRILSDEAPYAFLFFPYATPAINKRFKGIEPAPAGIGYNFIDWYVPEDEVKYRF